jgi:hypothetical protein
MKRILLALALALPVGAATAPALAVPMSSLAPADRYFGRMKMSILGIRNSLKDLRAIADLHPEDASHVFGKAVFVEDALRDWQHQFPRDPWIPKFSYALAQLYGKLRIDNARVHRNQMLHWLAATYPHSEFARLPRE